MYVDTEEPWQHMSTPENQADLDLRKEFEAAVERAYEADIAIQRARNAWEEWREEFYKSTREDEPDDGDDD